MWWWCLNIFIYIYFIKRNVSFVCISEYPCDFIKCNISLLCVSEYLQELRDLYKDYPLAPECLQIENILSNYQGHLLQDEGFIKPPPKLVLNLCNKLNYIIHYCNLKLNLKLGLPLSTVHHVLSFNQWPWLKNYINFLTLVNVQLWKMICKKISLSWWTMQYLVNLHF